MEKSLQEAKEESLLSNLSNISFQGFPKQYCGDDIFKESLPPGHHHKSNS